VYVRTLEDWNGVHSLRAIFPIKILRQSYMYTLPQHSSHCIYLRRRNERRKPASPLVLSLDYPDQRAVR
jgi:hypothetical protein